LDEGVLASEDELGYDEYIPEMRTVLDELEAVEDEVLSNKFDEDLDLDESGNSSEHSDYEGQFGDEAVVEPMVGTGDTIYEQMVDAHKRIKYTRSKILQEYI
jgi:hypothetical protein